MDEPTNDLDVETLRALEEAIDGYPGCAVIVSHDRYFLDRVATHTLAFEDDGGVVSEGEMLIFFIFQHWSHGRATWLLGKEQERKKKSNRRLFVAHALC